MGASFTKSANLFVQTPGYIPANYLYWSTKESRTCATSNTFPLGSIASSEISAVQVR